VGAARSFTLRAGLLGENIRVGVVGQSLTEIAEYGVQLPLDLVVLGGLIRHGGHPSSRVCPGKDVSPIMESMAKRPWLS